MGHETLKFESAENTRVVPPPLESLIEEAPSNTPWPREILDHPERIREAKLRTGILRHLDTLYRVAPQSTRELPEILATNEISEHDAIELYSDLTTLLKDDPLNGRLALYFPFELIPNKGAYEGVSAETVRALKEFTRAFKKSWYNLLPEHELRADYVDGDIVEIEHRTAPLPRVSKAAHLIPILVERGVLDTSEVLSILERTNDHILKSSIGDALTVMADLNLLSANDLEYMERSDDQFMQNMARIIRAKERNGEAGEPQTSSPDALLSGAESDEKRLLEKMHDTAEMTEGRRTWVTETETQKIVDRYAIELSAHMSEDELGTERFKERVAEQTASDLKRSVLVGAVRHHFETRAHEDLTTVQQEFDAYLPILAELRTHGSPRVQREIDRTVHHLHSLGVLSIDELERFGLPRPLLGASSQEILNTLRDDIREFTSAAEHLDTHPELKKLVYPVVVFLGSRMKGYATDSADLDIAVFVRPGTTEDERGHLQTLLNETFAHTKAEGKAMEFWLSEENDILTINDYFDPDPQRGDSTLPHPLIGAWCGDRSAISELYSKLMPGYLHSHDKTILGVPARKVWLKEIEHNVLQYRLMHKGYDRFNARQGGIRTPHRDEIDGDSSFYDSGFRRLATKLYIERVFLPQLDR